MENHGRHDFQSFASILSCPSGPLDPGPIIFDVGLQLFSPAAFWLKPHQEGTWEGARPNGFAPRGERRSCDALGAARETPQKLRDRLWQAGRPSKSEPGDRRRAQARLSKRALGTKTATGIQTMHKDWLQQIEEGKIFSDGEREPAGGYNY